MPAPAIEIEADGRAVRVSNPQKVYFPEKGITKEDVVRYFLAVEDGILRAVDHRPTAMERWPRGVVPGAKLAVARPDGTTGPGEAFFQKRLPKKGTPDWIESVRTLSPNGNPADTFCPNGISSILWAANLGTLRFHPHPVTRADLEHPDQMRIDLDPQPGVGFDETREVAHVLHGLLDELELASFPKTSGGRGIHVIVPLRTTYTYVEVRRAVIALGREVEQRTPLATVAWWKEERGERVFLDFNQMAPDKMVTAAYSIRPQPHAQVSTPFTWDELDDIRPEDFDVRTVPERFADRGDPHAAMDPIEQDLERVLDIADAHEADGLGDLPYPPGYPKMPGEPRRVQPSKYRHDLPD